MYKLLSFFAFLAVAFAAPAPEPGALLSYPAIAPLAYKAPLAYAPTLGYAPLPAAPFPYNAPYAYPAYSAPIAYSKYY